MAKEKTNKPEEIQVISVRNKRTTIDVVWIHGKDRHAVEFHENALPSFFKSVEALTAHAVALCELRSEDAAKVVPTGVTVKESGGDNLKALITFKRKLKLGKRLHNVTTPFLLMYEDEENKAADHMEPDQAKAIEKVLAEAKRYVLGDRAQGEISFADGDEAEEGAKAKPADAGANTEPLKFEAGAAAANA